MARRTPGQWVYKTVRPPTEATQKEAADPIEQLNELGTAGRWGEGETRRYHRTTVRSQRQTITDVCL